MNQKALLKSVSIVFLIIGNHASAEVRYVQGIDENYQVRCYQEDPANPGYPLSGSAAVDQDYPVHCIRQDLAGLYPPTNRNIWYVLVMGSDGKDYCYLADPQCSTRPLAGAPPVAPVSYPRECIQQLLRDRQPPTCEAKLAQ